MPPGRYIVYATETGPLGQTRFATAEVSVSGEHVDGLWLTLTSGASAGGQIAPAAERFSLGDSETRHITLPLRAAP